MRFTARNFNIVIILFIGYLTFKDDFFIFGPESRGIPEEILKAYWKNTITITMSDKIRSINLANSVAIVLYEGIRQLINR